MATYRGLALGALAVVICGMVATSQADVITIPDVPSYIWYNGCGPTALGMIIGYWEAHGYENLIAGSNSWTTNNAGVKMMIASPGHIAQYAPTPDCNLVPHADNCVADFSWTSRDWTGHTTPFGWSAFGMQPQGLLGYAAFKGYTCFDSWTETYYDDPFWAAYIDEILAERPVELLIDSNQDGTPDHFVTGIGFDNSTSTLKYGCYNTWDQIVHWYDVGFCLPSKNYGVYGATYFDPIPEPVSVLLLATGMVTLVGCCRRMRKGRDTSVS